MSHLNSTSRFPILPISVKYSTGNRYLDAYLDRMTEMLKPEVSEEQCERLWLESADHLERLIERYQREGMATEMATIRATELYGKAEFAAEEFLQNWFDRRGTTGLMRRFGRANMTAFAWFAMAQVLYVVLLQVTVFLPNGSPIAIPFSPAHIRAIWPEPLPFPSLSPEFIIQIGFPILVPFVAGWFCGKQIPTRAGAAVYHALLPLILYSFVLGALLLPTTQALFFALFELAFWLPVGCLVAHLSSYLARIKRMRATDRSNEGSSI